MVGARDMVATLAAFPSEVATALSLPPPLWGRGGEGGSHKLRPLPEPLPSLALPHKGGGNAVECAASSARNTPRSTAC